MNSDVNAPFPLIVWRDSVCAGDDGDAPHEKVLQIQPDETLAVVVQRLLDGRYLASISGGRATWVLAASRPLAVVAQQWPGPRYLVSSGACLVGLIEPAARPHLRFLYRTQADPGKIFAELSGSR